jgi:hypothetical protein
LDPNLAHDLGEGALTYTNLTNYVGRIIASLLHFAEVMEKAFRTLIELCGAGFVLFLTTESMLPFHSKERD